MSIIIAITNQKGGVGKTTTSVNLATSLALSGFRVLIVDFDPQAHTTVHLSDHLKPVDPSYKSETGIYEVLKRELTPEQVLLQTVHPNLKIISSHLKLGSFNQNSPVGLQFKLKESFSEEFLAQFDFVFIDCQPSLSLLTLNALTMADFVLLPVQAEFLALDGLTQLIVTLKEVRAKLHPKLTVLGVLVTMYDSRNRLSGEVYDELKKNFGSDLLTQVIPRNVKLAEAPSFGKSIFDYDAFSSGSKAYKDLSEELLTRLKLK
jgi:chromosome partitioning protein